MRSTEPSLYLYRYRTASESTFAELADGLGWYSRYDCLNDPFEGSYVNRTDEPVFDQLIESLRVLCFSHTNENLLLWAHYADNHRGICLEYGFTDDVHRGQCFPVNYSGIQPVLERVERYPASVPAAGSLSIHKDREANVFLTKSQDWSYEQEYRLLSLTEDPGARGERRPIPADLTAVYFGLRTSPQVISVVERLLDHRPSVVFRQASLSPGEYRLKFEPKPRTSPP
jgi:Protein of unknown function (DUF2971)